MAQKTTNTKRPAAAKSKAPAKKTPAKRNTGKGRVAAKENQRSTGVLVMLLGLILALWFGVIFISSLSADNKLLTNLLHILSGVGNVAIALFVVYIGLSLFVQKEAKWPGWQVLGWLFFCLGILGMLHLGQFDTIKSAFMAARQGLGGGICGFLVAALVVLIPNTAAQYVVLSAISILGLLLGTDLKIISCLTAPFRGEKDPERKAERQAQRAEKKEAKRQAREEAQAAAAKQAAIAEKEAAQQAAEQRQAQAQNLDLIYPHAVKPQKADKFHQPPVITDYSGKLFEEIKNFDDITVGDLLDEEDPFDDPVYIRQVMPRVTKKKSLDDITEKDLEQFADQAAQMETISQDVAVSNHIETDLASVAREAEPLRQRPDTTAELAKTVTKAAAMEEGFSVLPDGTIVWDKPTASEQPAVAQPAPQPAPAQASVVTPAAAPIPAGPAALGGAYQLPPISLLKGGINIKNPRIDKQIMDDSIALEQTLASFGVKTKVVEVVSGPSVIRFELQPAPGVKVSKIVNLADDIALALAAKGLRIEAPVPGKSVVGIEIAKSEVNPVYFKDVLSSEKFQKSTSKLSIAFGVDINGNAMVGDLAEMPHLLIAGATGSGKSVCMNTLICSILYKAKPDEVKIIMVDPKKVELASYNGLPHLGRPVVTNPKKAAGVLKEVVNEMERRYTVFASSGVKNFSGFNQLPDVEKMPQIVVLIDELADLMMVASHDVEDAVCRLAQMARAAGIHLVIATQRPSVDVITGLIKANVPSRIAFAVSSQIDSRTILDMGGAEKLLGKGDMLYFPIGNSKPVRVQGAFVTEEEIQRLVEYCSSQASAEFLELPAAEESSEEQGNGGPEEEDELFLDACQQVIVSGQASASSLQRRFRIGYNRAARLIETMEELHIISAAEGNKRTVLIGQELFTQQFLNQAPPPEQE